LKDQTMAGEVVKVNQYAEPGGWGSGTIKKYATIIKILDPPPALRVNMNAEVRIYVERRPDALQIPVQALAEYKGHYFAVVKEGEHYQTKELQIASTNDTSAVVTEGLQKDAQVVLNPRSHGTLLVFPEVKEKAPPNLGSVPPPGTVQPTSINAGGPNGGSPGNGPPGANGGGGSGRRGGGSPAEMLARLDTDNDGKLSMAELEALPEQFRSRLTEADKNHDGFVDKTELAAMPPRPPRPNGPEGGGAGQ